MVSINDENPYKIQSNTQVLDLYQVIYKAKRAMCQQLVQHQLVHRKYPESVRFYQQSFSVNSFGLNLGFLISLESSCDLYQPIGWLEFRDSQILADVFFEVF